VLGERGLARVQPLRGPAKALRLGDGHEDLELSKGHGGKPHLITEIRRQYFAYRRETRIQKRRARPAEGDPAMIFRQFLVPRTGCASYLFG
jgi:hypothetical protein